MRSRLPVLAMLICVLFFVDAVYPGEVSIMGIPGGTISFPIKSRKESRFTTTTRQQFDYSCGSAAISTLLTYHYGDPVGETAVFLWMYEHGDKEKIRRVGFSMLDMKKYLEARGYKAEGYRITLDQLAQASIPAVTLIDMKGYKHFVVVKGVTQRLVLLGDSATGIRIMPRSEFEGMWNDLAFVIQPPKRKMENFNRIEEWRVREQAPFGFALRAVDLANITFLLPGPGSAGP